MAWAIDSLQSGRIEDASQYIRFPCEAANSDIRSEYSIRKWELETLIGVLLKTPKYKLRDGSNKRTDCTHFNAAVKAVNCLAQFYRYAYIYGQGDCADYFERTY